MTSPSIDFIRKFRATATQLNGYLVAGDWMRLSEEIGFTAELAAEWADLGYMPAEAAPKIRAGVTPADEREDQAAKAAADRALDRRD